MPSDDAQKLGEELFAGRKSIVMEQPLRVLV